jgi:sigma-54 dependent transcriptional regulator, acetoin dehydrogenase operon transcriptional activator AcoR
MDDRQSGVEATALLAALADPAWQKARERTLSQSGITLSVLDAKGMPLDGGIALSLVDKNAVRAFAEADINEVKAIGIGAACATLFLCGGQRIVLLASSAGSLDRAMLAAICGVLQSVLEVIVQRHMELAVRETLIEEQKAIIDHIGDGLMVLARGGIVRHANTVAGRILGIDPVKAIGRPLDELIDFEPIIGPIFSTGVGYVDRELIIDSPARHLHLLDTAIPITNACGRVVSVVNTFREFKRIRKIVGKYAGSHARYTFENIVGQSAGLLNAVASARKAARGSANLLLSGESGVGKEVFAQAIHNDSERQGHPFIAINCAALPHDLIESELFGHAPGSFTGATREGRPGKFESADGGTVFLDEISELPLDVQAKLLRVLQEREVTRLGDTRGIQIDVRIVCASNRDLQAMVRAKAFREDLYYRCNVIDITIPPLRQRQDDIPVLASFFVAKYAALLRKNIYGFTPRALQQMSAYAWPGNVRELENFVERMVNLSEDGAIGDVSSLFRGMQTAEAVVENVGDIEPPQVVSLAEAERRAIEEALRSCAFNMTRCAAVLAVSKPALYAKLKRHGIRLRRTLQ